MTAANEVRSSSSKQGQEVGKVSTEQDFVKDSDIDAAKIAAMKAAELGKYIDVKYYILLTW